MASQNEIKNVAPQFTVVAAISEIIAPVVVSIANGLIVVASKIAESAKRSDVVSTQKMPAPHVAMITVPGNFVTDAFSRR